MKNVLYVESFRVKVYVIEAYLEKVLEAVKTVTNLKYGNYDGVSWASCPGVERCVAREGSTAYDGEVDQPFSTNSIKLEFSIPRDKSLLGDVVEKIMEVHPWDEPVISISETLDTRKNGIV